MGAGIVATADGVHRRMLELHGSQVPRRLVAESWCYVVLVVTNVSRGVTLLLESVPVSLGSLAMHKLLAHRTMNTVATAMWKPATPAWEVASHDPSRAVWQLRHNHCKLLQLMESG